ncbi:MAG: aconitate hydratase AcnA [Burkholderiales bacterium]|nr:aconitate hydratase AcnA [Burkholderiales bacterium]
MAPPALATLSAGGRAWRYVSLPQAERQGPAGVSRLPYVLRIVLENLLRQRLLGSERAGDVESLLAWRERAQAHVQFRPARVMMDDTAGLPLLGELAAMRDAAKRRGVPASAIDLALPLDFIVDHSIVADHSGCAGALERNMALEMERNAERYRFLRWAGQALRGLRIVPPGRGICHQVNLEHLAQVVRADADGGLAYPDSMIGIDSHTPMANALGVVAWGVSGIEGLSAALGEPVALRVAEVVGCRLSGRLRARVTATDLVLTLTELMRRHGVVGKIIEYIGPGAAKLSVPDRATVANMTPEAGATMSYFPIDGETLRYLESTGRDRARIELVETYAKAQGLWYDDTSLPGYSEMLEVDLDAIEACVAGPRLPHGRVALRAAPLAWGQLLHGAPLSQASGRETDREVQLARPDPKRNAPIRHGDVVIAALTSCTNTSNPALMLGAGLLARNAVRRGLRTKPWVKTSLSPGSRVVAAYLRASGLQSSLDALGFQVTGFGCMTCVGFSGPLDESIEAAMAAGVRAVAVHCGNRNYQGRAHRLIASTFLVSPPLVIAYALAGTMRVDLTSAPIGNDHDGRPVYLRELWPEPGEIAEIAAAVIRSELYERSYADIYAGDAPWGQLEPPLGPDFAWDPASTMIRPPPVATSPEIVLEPAIRGARLLALYEDMVTTEHISPMGPIPRESEAARYLESLGVLAKDFVSYAARRLNHDVMVRGTFSSPYLVNELAPGEPGGYTRYAADRRLMTIFAAAQRYGRERVPLVVIAGRAFGAGSSRDWSAKGPRALGVRAVIAQSYERIYRANLAAAGVWPLEFDPGHDRKTLALDGTESIDILGCDRALSPGARARAIVRRGSGETIEVPLVVRLDSAQELESIRHGGLLARVLRERIEAARA